MTLPITEPLAQWIRERIRLISSECQDPETARLARFLGALPVLADMGGLYALRPSGEVVSIDWDARTEIAVEDDPHVIDIALASGSRRYPELRTLLPPRPPGTPDCPDCNGTGIPTQFANHPVLSKGIACWCGGLGF